MQVTVGNEATYPVHLMLSPREAHVIIQDLEQSGDPAAVTARLKEALTQVSNYPEG